MESRGPDGAGLLARGHVILAHRRLAIRDLASPPQPWQSDDGSIAVVYNGEIYNDQDLRTELSKRRFRFRTRCDTELIPAAYQAWGRSFVDRLRGDFAIGLYDFARNRLLLVRDRCGAKPLYFGWVGGSFLFASTIGAIRGYSAFRPKPNWPVLSHYLTTLRLTLKRETVYENIYSLQPGERLLLEHGRVVIDRYWQPPAEEPHDDFHAAADAFETRLREAVRIRLAGDVECGVLLSGGVDSTTIACLAQGELGRKLPAGCGTGFDRTAKHSSDAEFAADAARLAGCELTNAVVGPEDYREAWLDLLGSYRTPVSTPTDAILCRVSQAMKRSAGFVLGGEGADELLCGYAVSHFSGHDYDRAMRFDSGRWSPAPHVGRLFRESMRRSYGRDRFVSATDHYFALNSMIAPAAKPYLLQKDVWDAARRDEPMFATYHEQLSEQGDQPGCERLTRLLHRVNLEALLSRLDAAAMQAGLEVRPVFADHLLVEETFRLPERFKIAVAEDEPAPFLSAADLSARGSLRDKRLLRAVAARLMPSRLAYRPKASFPTPVADWLGREFSTWVSQTLRTSPFADAILQANAREELAEQPERAGLWLWPIMNVVLWGDREFAA